MAQGIDIARIPEGVFLVTAGKTTAGEAWTAHTFGLSASAHRTLSAALGAGPSRQVRLKVHRRSSVRGLRNIAGLAERFSQGEIVYDPTAIFGRLQSIADCACLLRDRLTNKVSQILLDPTRRSLFVVLNEKAFSGEGLVFRAEVAQAMDLCGAALSAWRASAPVGLDLSVCMGFAPPSDISVIAVDKRSQPRRRLDAIAALGARVRRLSLAAATGALAAGIPSLAAADDTSAVSRPNISLLGRIGSEDNAGGKSSLFRGDALIEGALPLGHSFGVQAEAAGGANSYYGVGGHLFWRDPSWGLVGGVASHESLRGVDMDRFGGELEGYIDRFTLSLRGGYQTGDVAHGGFVRGEITFYPTDNFLLRGGFESQPGLTNGRAGLEYRPAIEAVPGLSLFVDSTFGSGTGVFAGIRFHFGEDGESLLYRDRHEDPANALFNRIPTRRSTGYTSSPAPKAG